MKTATMRESTSRCAGCRFGQNRMQCRDDRHGEPRQQHHDAFAGLASENTEFVLQRHGLELAAVQEIRGRNIVFEASIVDLETDGGRIIVDLTMIGHGDDGRLRDQDASRRRRVADRW